MRVNTLLFHDVVPDGEWSSSGFQGADADIYKLECDEFRRHLAALPNQVTTTPEILKHHRENSLLITFDDGGISAFTHTADILERFGWRGHFLVTAGRIGTAGFMDRAQILELHQRGHIIGSHSYSHPTRMALCSEQQLKDEWQRSVDILSEILGTPVDIASVPGGFYSRQVAVTAAEAGIKLLFNSEPVTTTKTVAGCMVLGRLMLQRGHPPERSAAIARGDRSLLMKEYLFWNSKKAAKALLGTAWLKARVILLKRKSRN